MTVIAEYRVAITLLLLALLCVVTSSNLSRNRYARTIKSVSVKSLDTKKKRLLKFKFISEIIEGIALRLDIATADHKKSVRMASTMLVMYAVSSVAMFACSILYTKAWYMFLMNMLIASVIPFIVIRLFLNMLIQKAVKQLPRSLDELESAFYRSNKLRKAIELAYPMMPVEISRIFKMLYNDMLNNELEAVERFRLVFNNEHANSLCVLFRLYIQDGGTDIAQQLQQLNSMIHDEVTSNSQSSSKLLKYKILAVITLIVLPLFILLASRISPDILSYYTDTVAGSNLLSLAIISTVLYYILVEIIERI